MPSKRKVGTPFQSPVYIHQASMVHPNDYLSLTSPHPITYSKGHTLPTAAHYIAFLIFRGLQIDKSADELSTWDAVGVIYQTVLKSGEGTIKHVQTAVIRALLLKVHQHRDVRQALLRTGRSRIIMKGDHQTICNNERIAREQNERWARPYASILTWIRRQECKAAKPRPLEPIYIVTSSLMYNK